MLDDRRFHRAADRQADVCPNIESGDADVCPKAGPAGAARLHGREGDLRRHHGNNGPGLADGLADELDKGSMDGAGLDEGPGVGTDDGARLAEVLAELESRQSKIDALRAKLDEGTAARRRGRHGTRPATRQAGRQ